MSLRPSLRKKPSLPPPVLPSDELEGTRRRILETALHLFATHGFAGTSVRDITTALELQPSALYAHFTSKEQLLAELSRFGHAAQEAALRSSFDAAPADPAAQLRALVHTNALLHAAYPHLAVVVNEELHSLPAQLAAPSLAIRGRTIALLMDVLERGVEDKQFTSRHLEVTSAAIAAISSRIPYWYEPREDLDPETLADIQVELVLRMVGVMETPTTARSKGKRR